VAAALPGGDPLAAALAARETPAPELVREFDPPAPIADEIQVFQPNAEQPAAWIGHESVPRRPQVWFFSLAFEPNARQPSLPPAVAHAPPVFSMSLSSLEALRVVSCRAPGHGRAASDRAGCTQQLSAVSQRVWRAISTAQRKSMAAPQTAHSACWSSSSVACGCSPRMT